jgi:hypothetical protein
LKDLKNKRGEALKTIGQLFMNATKNIRDAPRLRDFGFDPTSATQQQQQQQQPKPQTTTPPPPSSTTQATSSTQPPTPHSSFQQSTSFPTQSAQDTSTQGAPFQPSSTFGPSSSSFGPTSSFGPAQSVPDSHRSPFVNTSSQPPYFPTGAAPTIPSEAELNDMHAKELKQLAQALGIDCSSFVEKDEYRRAILARRQ